MTILSIDYGRRQIGLAIFQNDQVFTIPPISGESRFVLRDKLNQVVDQYEPEVIILGKPPHGPIQKDVESLKDLLEQRDKKVHLFDEGLTTVQAEHEMHMENMSSKDRKKHVDSLSAESLLRGYLESVEK